MLYFQNIHYLNGLEDKEEFQLFCDSQAVIICERLAVWNVNINLVGWGKF